MTNRIFPLLIQVALALSLLAFSSCNNNQNPEKGVITIDLRDFSDVEDEALLREAIIIPLELTDKSILDHYGVACSAENGIFYRFSGGRSGIYHFDNRGKFVCTIGSIGKGPGEFSVHQGVVITDKEVVFDVFQKSAFYSYDFSGHFLKSIDYQIEDVGSFSWHPKNGDYYIYSPMNDYLIYKLDSETHQFTDSAFLNPNKERVGINCFNRTFEGNLLFNDPIDFNLNIFELGETVNLKYIFEYGLVLEPNSTNYENWQKIEEEQGIWFLEYILENSDWLYIGLQSQKSNDKSFKDYYHLVYHKETKRIYRLPGHLNDETYFRSAFWLNEENYLSIIINPYQIADNPFWIEAYNEQGIPLDIEANPIVVKIPLDTFLE